MEVGSGALPIVITSPHGGGMAPSDVSARVCDEQGEVCLNDQNTHLIAAAVVDELELLLGARPYKVINRIDRRYIDQNRSNAANPAGANAAYEDADARPYYEFFHGAIRESVDRVVNDFGRGLLVDVHGQSSYDHTVIRGTRNGQTVTQLLEASGESSLTGPSSMFGQLEKLGYPVTPPNAPLSEEREEVYNGGHIVGTYGSHRTNGIDAIQIEFSRDFRVSSSDPDIWQQSGKDLAAAIAVFFNTYLAEPDLPGDFNGDGQVDAADYTTWRDHLGQETLLPGDPTPGLMSRADLQAWRENFGSTAGASGAAAPEPAGILFAAMAAVATGCRTRATSQPARLSA